MVGDVQGFIDEHLGRRPLIRRGVGLTADDGDGLVADDGDGLVADDGDGWPDLLTLEDVDRLLRTTRAPAFRLVRDGQVLPRSRSTRSGTVGGVRVTDLPDVGRIHEEFRAGATVVLQGLNRSHPPVAALCRGIERVLTYPVQANAYLTPPSAAGLDVHHDTHDVIALQLHGHKDWTTWAAQVVDPLAGQSWSGAVDELGAPQLEERLGPGDLLYLPRGTLHAARTPDAPSLHLTIGLRSTTAHDVLRLLVSRARDEAAFRTAAPAGFARDRAAAAGWIAGVVEELATWAAAVDAEQVADQMAESFFASRPPLLDGQLRQLLALDDIDDDTLVTRRDGVTADLRSDEDRITLQLGDRTVTMPAFTEPAVARLLTAADLPVSALAEELGDEHSRIVLVRRLVREGLLEATQGRDR